MADKTLDAGIPGLLRRLGVEPTARNVALVRDNYRRREERLAAADLGVAPPFLAGIALVLWGRSLSSKLAGCRTHQERTQALSEISTSVRSAPRAMRELARRRGVSA